MASNQGQMDRYTISMRPVDWATVHQVAKDFALTSRSAAVRFIVQDWVKMKAAEQGYHQFETTLAGTGVNVPVEVVAGE